LKLTDDIFNLQISKYVLEEPEMIKLPKKMVIYPQKRSKPDYLLCWIPAEYYEVVATSQEVKQELDSDFPNGVEIELSEDGLEEFGIQLETPVGQLRQAFLELNAEGALPESGMIEVEMLDEFIKEREAGRSIEEITQPPQPDTLSFDVTEASPLQKLKEGPEMEGDEEAQNLFQRLSVRQVKPQVDPRGDE
jgi:hypothetical protein